MADLAIRGLAQIGDAALGAASAVVGAVLPPRQPPPVPNPNTNTTLDNKYVGTNTTTIPSPVPAPIRLGPIDPSSRRPNSKTPSSIDRDLELMKSDWERRVKSSLKHQNDWEFIRSVLKRIEGLKDENSNLKRQYIEFAKEMIDSAKRWSIVCGEEIVVPKTAPSIRGFEDVTQWISNRFVASTLNTLRPRVQEFLLYGMPGSGKTIASSLIAQSMSEVLSSAWNVFRQESKIPESTATPTMLTYYKVNAMQLRAMGPTRAFEVLQNYMNCLDVSANLEYEHGYRWGDTTGTFRDRTSLRPLSLLAIDNLDVFFTSTDALQKQPRPARQEEQLIHQGFSYDSLLLKNDSKRAGTSRIAVTSNGSIKSSNGGNIRKVGGVVVKQPTSVLKTKTSLIPNVSGRKQNSTIVANNNTNQTSQTGNEQKRVGGDAGDLWTESSQNQFANQLMDLFNPANMEEKYPQVRVLFIARYPWALPDDFHNMIGVANRRYIDLPSTVTRESLIRQFLAKESFKNWFQWLTEMRRRRPGAFTNYGKETPSTEAKSMPSDTNLLTLGEMKDFLEKKAREIQQTDKMRDADITIVNALLETNANPKNPDDLASFLLQDTGLLNLYRDYVEKESDLVQTIAAFTGMTVEGLCRLKSVFSESNQNAWASQFLLAMNRQNDNKGTNASSPFGYTIEELMHLLMDMVKVNNGELLQQGLKEIKAYIPDNENQAYSGCSEFIRSNRPFERTNDCHYKLNGQLVSVQKGGKIEMPFPLSIRFGTHRFTRKLFVDMTRITKSQNSNISYVLRQTYDKQDYLKFAMYAMTGQTRIYDRPPGAPIPEECKPVRKMKDILYQQNVPLISQSILKREVMAQPRIEYVDSWSNRRSNGDRKYLVNTNQQILFSDERGPQFPLTSLIDPSEVKSVREMVEFDDSDDEESDDEEDNKSKKQNKHKAKKASKKHKAKSSRKSSKSSK